MRVISPALLPAFYLAALPADAATLPDAFEAKKQATVPDNLTTHPAYESAWDYVQKTWAQKYPALTVKDNKYLAQQEIQLVNPDFSKQSVMLLNHSYSLDNTVNSVQLNLGDGFSNANGSEAINTLVKGELANSKGKIETGVLAVDKGGKAFNTTVEANGMLSLRSSSEAYNTWVKAGGQQILGAGSYAQANIIDGGLQQLSVMSDARAEDTVVKIGGSQIIYGGSAINSHIGAGSYQMTSGMAEKTVLYRGAFQQVYAGQGAGYVADRQTTVMDGAFQQVVYGTSEQAQVHGTQVISGVDVSWSDGQWNSDPDSRVRVTGQSASDATIYASGQQRIQTGNADGTQIYGLQTVSRQKGGWVNGQWVDAEGYVNGTGASATHTTVFSGGVQHVAVYGAVSDTVIDGGTQRVDALGHIADTTIKNGGNSTIQWGGYSTGNLDVVDGNLTLQGGGLHDWTKNLGKGAYAQNVDLQGEQAVLTVQHNAAAPESVVTIEQLTNNGVVNFSAGNTRAASGFSRLELNKLDGHGAFIMNTNLAGTQGDFLSVSDSVAGKFNILVRDSGQELAGGVANAYHLIYANGSTSNTFTINNGSVDLGAYKYYLQHGTNADKDNWYLSPVAINPNPEPTPDPDPTPEPDTTPNPGSKPELSESAKAVLAMANVTPTIWDAELSTLRTRLGEVRDLQVGQDGVWGKYITSRYRISTQHVDYRQDLNGVMFGIDRNIALDNSQVIAGGMMSYSRSDLSASSTDGKVDSYGLGAYLTWLHRSGYYVDGIIKANHFLTENNPYFNGTRTHGRDNTLGGGLSLEAGKHIVMDDYFIEPYLQGAFFQGQKTRYKLDSGMTVSAEAARSVKGEAGVTFGKHFTLANGAQLQPYARVAVRQEFIKNNDVTINHSERFSNDMSGTSGKYGLGMTASLSDRWSAYGEVSYEMGKHIETPYSGQIGFRYSF